MEMQRLTEQKMIESLLDRIEYCNDSYSDIWLTDEEMTLIKKALEEVQSYRKAEEQGLLLSPKVALNSFVYWDSGYWGIIPYKVCNISYSIHGFCYEICAFKGDELLDCQEVVDDDFGKYVFLTREEAEQALKKMKGE